MKTYLLRILTELGQMKQSKDETKSMVMDTDVRSNLIEEGWNILSASEQDDNDVTVVKWKTR